MAMPATQALHQSEAIIANVLGRAPDVQLSSQDGDWQLCRWRQFVGSYKLPALPDPVFVVHVGGKPNVRTWLRDAWSESASLPGCATFVPSKQPTGWLVDGELDVVTLSVSPAKMHGANAEPSDRMRFAFSDPLGVALTRQILAELYTPQSQARDAYVSVLTNALRAHMMRGPAGAGAAEFPVSAFSSYRINAIISAVLDRPEADHSLEAMAAQADVTPAHLCRVFKQATGVTPHQYVLRVRLEKAMQMLERTDASIAMVAESLGFSSQSHFARAFRQFVGETPTEFQKRGRRAGAIT